MRNAAMDITARMIGEIAVASIRSLSSDRDLVASIMRLTVREVKLRDSAIC